MKYGTARDSVLGLRAVDGTGRSLRTGCRTTKGVVGYDISRLLIGSEGTLALITEATLRLLPRPSERRTLRASYRDVASAAAAVARIMGQATLPCALEFMDGDAVTLASQHADIGIPAGTGALLLMAADGDADSIESSCRALAAAAAGEGLIDILTAGNAEEAEQVWAARKALSPALRKLAPKKVNEDVAVPVTRLSDLVTGLGQLSRVHGLRIVSFGHAGNGNLHVNLLADPDDPAQMHRNEETFRGAIDALCRGDAVQIYPEGRSHSDPSLAPLRTGAARIALRAEAERNWELGLRVVPIGLTFRGKHLFRGRVLAMIGEPFSIADLQAAWEADAVAAARILTDRIADALAAVTLNLAEHRDGDLIDTAERLYTREKGAASWRERDPLAERVPRMRAFARGLEWLRRNDPERHQRLARSVARYRRRAELLGVQDGDVPPRYGFGATLNYVVAEGALLLLLALPALAGSLVWYPAWLAPRATLRIVKPEHEAVATYKLATAFLMVPLTIVACVVIGALLDGLRGAALAAVFAPLSGLVALAWHERLARVREDATLFFRVALRRDHRERLARDRARLAAELMPAKV